MSGVPTMGHLAREAALLRERIPLGDPALRQRIGLYGTGFLGAMGGRSSAQPGDGAGGLFR
jgi:hypothetical protein